jgi:hypothetical protein
MARPPIQGKKTPILVDVVDRLLEFHDNAVDDTADLASLASPARSGRVFTDVVDRLIELTDSAVENASIPESDAKKMVNASEAPAINHADASPGPEALGHYP